MGQGKLSKGYAHVSALRAIYRESSLANGGDRDVLLAHPDVLEWDATAVADGRTRVALIGETIVGFGATLDVIANPMAPGAAGELPSSAAPEWVS